MLPPELLSRIFHYCVCDGSTFESNTPPWTLGRVSSYWRQVSINTPELWTSIHIDIEKLNSRTEKGISSLLQTALERSGQRPLDIEIVYPYYLRRNLPSTSTVHWQRIFDCLCGESRRWGLLHVVLGYNASAEFDGIPIISLPQDASFGSLVEVSIDRSHATDLRLLILRKLVCPPRLRRLCLDGLEDLEEIVPVIPWGQIVKLELYGARYDESTRTALLNILSCCTSRLQAFVTSDYGWEKLAHGEALPFPVTLISPSFHAETIVDLNLDDTPGSTNTIAGDLGLSSLSLPSLQHLSVSHHRRHDVGQLVGLIERSECNLLSLRYYTNKDADIMSEASIERVLRIPQVQRSLRRLELHGQIYGNVLFGCFFDTVTAGMPIEGTGDTRSRETFLPALEELTIRTFKIGNLRSYNRLLGRRLPPNAFRDLYAELTVRANFTSDRDEVQLELEAQPISEQTLLSVPWDLHGALQNTLELFNIESLLGSFEQQLDSLLSSKIPTDLVKMIEPKIELLRGDLREIIREWSRLQGDEGLWVCGQAHRILTKLKKSDMLSGPEV